MTVYLLYAHGLLLGVYSARHLAEDAYFSRYPGSWGGPVYEIEELTLDQPRVHDPDKDLNL